MNQTPDELGEAAASVDPARRHRDLAQTPELLTTPTEAPRFNLGFINSGRSSLGGERRGGGTEGGAGGMVYSYNYPTLLVMIIILLREWDSLAPQPCPLLHFGMWSE